MTLSQKMLQNTGNPMKLKLWRQVLGDVANKDGNKVLHFFIFRIT
jgi:hypothetical protein